MTKTRTPLAIDPQKLPKGVEALSYGDPGRYRIRVNNGTDRRTGKPIVERRVVGPLNRKGQPLSLRDLQIEAESFRSEVREGRNKPSSAMTCNQLFERLFTTLKAQGRAANTLDAYRREVRLRWAPAIGHLKLHQVMPEHFQAVYDRMGEQGYSASSIHHTHTVANEAFNMAIHLRLVAPPNPCAGTIRASVLPGRGKAPKKQALVEVLLESARHDPAMNVLFQVGAGTGCRRGEVCGLRWSDIDAEEGTLEVQRAVAVVPPDQSTNIEYRWPEGLRGRRSRVYAAAVLWTLKEGAVVDPGGAAGTKLYDRLVKRGIAPTKWRFYKLVEELCGDQYGSVVVRDKPSPRKTAAIALANPNMKMPPNPFKGEIELPQSWGWEATDTKTHRAKTVPLPSIVQILLNQHLAAMVKRAVWAGVQADPNTPRWPGYPLSPDAYIFSHEPDCLTPMNPPLVTDAFERARSRAGHPKMRLHDLRHLYATILLSNGIDIATVSELMGHSTQVVTLTYYSHVLNLNSKKLAAKLIGEHLPLTELPDMQLDLRSAAASAEEWLAGTGTLVQT